MVARIIPVAERALFRMYAATLLEGPPIATPLCMSLVLVLLLHHDTFNSEYPDHRLVTEMRLALVKCNVGEGMFTGWVKLTKQFNVDVNKAGLTLSQVYNL